RKQIEDVCRTAYVELGKRIVEQKNRRARRPFAERSRLEHAKGNRRRPVLARRAEGSQVAVGAVVAGDGDRKIVAVWPDMRQSALEVGGSLSLECRRERRHARVGSVECARVAHAHTECLADLTTELLEWLGDGLDPCDALMHEHRAALRE